MSGSTAVAARVMEIEGHDEAVQQNDRANKEAAKLILHRPVEASSADPVEYFRGLNEREGWSMSEIGDEVGYDASTVSKVFGGSYQGDMEAVRIAFGDAMNRLLGSGRGVLIRTMTSQIINEALLDSVGKEWTTVLYGDSGVGKTDAINRFVAAGRGKRHARRAVIITITMTVSIGSLVAKLADSIGVDSRGVIETIFRRIVDALKRRPHLIIIDETNNLDRMPGRAAQIINMLRQINDEAKCGLVFVGTSSLHRLIVDPKNREWADMLLSRVRLQHELPGASLLEARALLISHFGPLDLDAWKTWLCGYEAIMRSSQRNVDMAHGNFRAVGVFVDNARYFMSANKISAGAALTPEMIRMIWQRCGRRWRNGS